jgi:sugar phosphate permease
MNQGAKKYITLMSLSLSYGAIYALVYLKYILYGPMVEAFGISKGQLGFFMSMYAIACMVLYIPGGYVADKFSIKKILVISVAGNGLVCALLAFSMNYVTALIVWFLFGFTSAFAYWAALIKGVLSLSTEEDSGRIYSIYFFGGGIFSTIINTSLVWVYGHFSTAQSGIRAVIIVCAGVSFIAAILIAILFKDTKPETSNAAQEKFEFKHVIPLIKSPILWALALAIFSVYGLRVAGNTYFTPYLTEVKGVDLSSAAFIGVVRSSVFPMLAPIAGFLVDKLFKSTCKLFIVSFTLLGILFGSVLLLPASAPTALIVVVSLIPGAISAMTYGVMFSVLREAQIPSYLMGTAVGIASIIGYTPDFIFDPIFGSIIDKFGGKAYTIIFTTLIVFAAIGIADCLYIMKYSKKVSKGLLPPIGTVQKDIA